MPKQIDHEPYSIRMITINKLLTYWQKMNNIVGITRLNSINSPEKAFYSDGIYEYSKKDIETYRILSIDYSYNITVMNEIMFMEKSLENIREMKFPESIPVLHFISEDNCRLIEVWAELHKEIITETEKSEIIRLDRNHYLHFEYRDAIAENVREWIHKNEMKKFEGMEKKI